MRMFIAILFILFAATLWADIPVEISEKLVSEDVNERLDACLMLGRLGSEEAIPILKERLRDKSMLLRHSAANALARIGGTEVVVIFKEMVAAGGSEARRIGLAGLAMTGDPESIELVMVQLDDPDWQVRWSAVYALGKWGARAALPKLKKIAETDPYKNSATNEYPVRKRAAEMCQKIMSSIEWYRNFSSAMLLSKKLQRPVWIYWWVSDSKWCRILEEEVFFSKEISDISQHYICVKLDVEKDSSLVSQCEITGAPCNIILDKEGQEIDRMLGCVSRDELIKRLKNALENKGTPLEWKKKIAQNSSDIESLWYLAEWYLDNAKPQKALPLLEDIIKYDPKNQLGYTDNAIFVLGFSLGGLGKIDRAVELLQGLRNDYPKFKDMDKALYCLGLDYLSLGKVSKSKKILLELVKDYPESSVVKPTKEILGKL